MPRLLKSAPKYCRHKASGQAIVTLSGVDHYLGPYGSKASRLEYDRLIAEWLAAGRRHWRYAQSYYQKNGRPTKSIERVRIALRLLRTSYATVHVANFGPLSLQAIRQSLIESGKARKYINALIEQLKRVFKWGVSQELVPAATFQALSTLEGLRKGRSDAPERQPIGPVPRPVVDATLPHLPPVVADMVRLQSLTGCRPGEVCILRPCDVDRSGKVWSFRPASHKTEHHGRERVICIGPRAQEILRPYLLRESTVYCFTPAESERKRLETRHAVRKTPLSCGNRPSRNRKRRRKLLLGDRYESGAYANCIRRGADLADRKARAAAMDADPNCKDERIVPRWTPNQLRHRLATDVRKRFGLEAVQVVLGHAKAEVSQI
jgi:integrase